jgi:hypothetical protein
MKKTPDLNHLFARPNYEARFRNAESAIMEHRGTTPSEEARLRKEEGRWLCDLRSELEDDADRVLVEYVQPYTQHSLGAPLLFTRHKLSLSVDSKREHLEELLKELTADDPKQLKELTDNERDELEELLKERLFTSELEKVTFTKIDDEPLSLGLYQRDESTTTRAAGLVSEVTLTPQRGTLKTKPTPALTILSTNPVHPNYEPFWVEDLPSVLKTYFERGEAFGVRCTRDEEGEYRDKALEALLARHPLTGWHVALAGEFEALEVAHRPSLLGVVGRFYLSHEPCRVRACKGSCEGSFMLFEVEANEEGVSVPRASERIPLSSTLAHLLTNQLAIYSGLFPMGRVS